MADKLLKDLNKINKLCKRLFDSYIICGDMIIGQNDGKACNNVFCRLNTVLDISIDNRDSVIHIVPDAIVYLFKEYKSKELDIVKQDENGNLICILPDKEIVFAKIAPMKDNIKEFISAKIKEINEMYDNDISYDLNDDDIGRLVKTKQVLIIKDIFKLFICKKIFPTIKRNGSDKFVFYFKDIDNDKFKSMSVMSDKDLLMNIFGIYYCVHF